MTTAAAPTTTHTEITTAGRDRDVSGAVAAAWGGGGSDSLMRTLSFLDIGATLGPPRISVAVVLGEGGVGVTGWGVTVLARGWAPFLVFSLTAAGESRRRHHSRRTDRK